MSFFSRRKPVFLNFGLLFIFVAGWIFSYMSPAIKGMLSSDGFMLKDFEMEDQLFFGTVTRATVPSIFGGTDIPFFDKVNFQINEDENANFVLYASQEMLDEMSEWFSFGAVNASVVPLEIRAARLDDNTYVVHSLASTDGEMDVESLVVNYQFYYAFVGLTLVLGLGLVGVALLILWFAVRRR
ncbi:hypothetical protein SAMN05720468_11338 [Fibrobacter sp. UWEL]|nr:hypothetical protein SAMN05720468_11338 [Fibrobacter sp. UWEL]